MVRVSQWNRVESSRVSRVESVESSRNAQIIYQVPLTIFYFNCESSQSSRAILIIYLVPLTLLFYFNYSATLILVPCRRACVCTIHSFFYFLPYCESSRNRYFPFFYFLRIFILHGKVKRPTIEGILHSKTTK